MPAVSQMSAAEPAQHRAAHSCFNLDDFSRFLGFGRRFASPPCVVDEGLVRMSAVLVQCTLRSKAVICFFLILKSLLSRRFLSPRDPGAGR